MYAIAQTIPLLTVTLVHMWYEESTPPPFLGGMFFKCFPSSDTYI